MPPTNYTCDLCGTKSEIDELTDREGSLTCPCCGAFTGHTVAYRTGYIAQRQLLAPAASAAI
jgi:predicted nucleic acid-binding Zn ribbon protein